MSLPRYVIGPVAIVVAMFAWWFVAGSSLVALVDRITTAPESEPTTPTRFTFDEANVATTEEPKLTFGERRRIAGSGWRVVEGPPGHASLETPNGNFVLGALSRTYALNQGQRGYEFAPDSGDVVTLTRRRSRMAWPRFLHVNWLGGSTPRWRRYVYYRLEWRKPNGPRLELVWRDEQRLVSGEGWMDQFVPAPPTVAMLH